MKYLKLHSGDAMPVLGLGTWRAEKGKLAPSITEALCIGYRHVDCAHVYANEAEAGDAFAALQIPREELFVTSKLWNNSQEPQDVRPSLEKTLKNLRLAYLDLYLVHWPVRLSRHIMYPEKGEHLIEWTTEHMLANWREMEKAVEDGLVRNIGVSNFSTKKMQIIMDNASILPAVSQVEMHPYLQQETQRVFCNEHGIALTGFAPLGSGNRPPERRQVNEPTLLDHEVLLGIAEKHNLTVGQVVLSWAVMRGTSVIPKSTNPERLRQNLESADIVLDASDVAAIAGLEKHYRFFDGSHWMIKNSPYTVENLWDGE